LFQRRFLAEDQLSRNRNLLRANSFLFCDSYALFRIRIDLAPLHLDSLAKAGKKEHFFNACSDTKKF
jgi:hypothetical protein